ncbi:MAG: extracellular solute-binding protein [Patescibacteria group bacterium]
MKRFAKIASYIIIAGLFSVALSGCTAKSQKTPETTKLIVWGFEEEDVWKPVKAEFEKANKGIELNYQKQIFDDRYETRVLNSMQSGQGPDVWAMPNDWVYRHKDKLVPMPANLAKNVNLDTQFVPIIKQSVNFDDKIYALSPYAEPMLVFWNSSIFKTMEEDYSQKEKTPSLTSEQRDKTLRLFQSFPKTWTEFTDLAKALTLKSNQEIQQSGVAMGSSNIRHSQDILNLLMLQNETKIVSDDLKIATFNLPLETPRENPDIPGKRALDFYTAFNNPNSANYSWNDSLGNSLDAFANGKVAMIFAYNSDENYLKQKYPSFSYKKAFVPQISEETNKITDFAKFTAFGVSNQTELAAQAWNLVYNFLVNDPSTQFVSGAGLYNSKKAAEYDIALANRDNNSPEKLELATAKTFNKGRFPVEFDNYIKSAIFAVNKGLQDSKQALDLAAENVTQLLKKTDW